MAKLGSDFRSTQPTDNDFVRHPSSPQMFTVLQDIKSRVKDFFDGIFDLDTGDLLPLVVPIAALRSLSKDPSGTWRRVTVNRKGQITAGDNDSSETAPRIFRAIFHGDSGKVSTVDTVTGSTIEVPVEDRWPLGEFDGATGWPTSIFTFQKFEFVVPAGVSRVRATLVGCGKDNGSSEAEARQRELSFSTTPGSILKIWAGSSDGSVSRISNAEQTKYADSGAWFAPTVGFPDVNVGWYASNFRGYGVDGPAPSDLGTPGFVILEWYA